MKHLITSLITNSLLLSSSLVVAGEAAQTDCLAKVSYWEAENQGRAGMEAVAHVVMNRVHSKAFPNNICDVTRQPGQFSNFTNLNNKWAKGEPWETAKMVANETLYGFTEDRTSTATDYHADYVWPYWADIHEFTVKIGNHLFYVRN